MTIDKSTNSSAETVTLNGVRKNVSSDCLGLPVNHEISVIHYQ